MKQNKFIAVVPVSYTNEEFLRAYELRMKGARDKTIELKSKGISNPCVILAA